MIKRPMFLFRLQPYSTQGAGDFAVSHEPTPDVSSAHVFGTQKNDAGVDADDVGVDPGGLGVEGVDEAVAAIDFGAVPIVHRLQSASGEVGSEH